MEGVSVVQRGSLTIAREVDAEVYIMQPNKVHEEVLMCGYRACCPTVKIFDDGSVELTDADTEAGSVGTIKLRSEAAERLVRLLTTQRR